MAIVAVDATPLFHGYDLVSTVSSLCVSLEEEEEKAKTKDEQSRTMVVVVLPVTPWGRFIPALNAIVTYCANAAGIDRVLMTSAEVKLTRDAMEMLLSKMTNETKNEEEEETLVVGAVLHGHDYAGAGTHSSSSSSSSSPNLSDAVEVALTGRTTPWNTCAVWDVHKLALTGFLLVSEGLHYINEEEEEDGTFNGKVEGGVEEVVTIALLQSILGPKKACAKLVQLPRNMVAWEVDDFSNDDKRRAWHERKMKSKVTRAQRQLKLLGLKDGVVIHC